MPLFETPEMTAELRATDEAMSAPAVGDHFTEMFAFHVYVLSVRKRVVVMEAHPPCQLPDDGKIRVFESEADFQNTYAYKSIPGYWVHLVKRGCDVEGWL